MKLLWLDMEMTGLVPEKEVPIEIAARVTDMHFNDLGHYHSVIKQPQKYLDAMDEWNTTHHAASGLTAQVPNGKSPETVDAELSAFVRSHFGDEKAILAGNSISQDRLFIRLYLPKLENVLHYRMVDVSSFKVIYNNLYAKKYTKKQAHRAVDDIGESIDELKFYLSFVKCDS